MKTDEEIKQEKELFLWKKKQKEKDLKEWVEAICIAIFIIAAIDIILKLIN